MQFRKPMLLGSTAVAVAVMGLSATVYAAGANKGTAEQGFSLEEILVTAQKRTENIQTTPVTVSAYDYSKLEREHANTIAALSTTPNVSLANVGAFHNSFAGSIRGIGENDIESSFDPGVGVVVDGVPLARNVAANIDLFDVESIEVLKGPQGTLFGANTPGGLLNIKTRRPSGEWGARAKMTIANFGRFDFRGSIEAPVVKDKLAIKISGLTEKSHGYFHNLYTNEPFGGDNTWSLRGTAVFTPNEQFKMTLIGDITHDRSDGSPTGNTLRSFDLFNGFFLGMFCNAYYGAGNPCHMPTSTFANNPTVTGTKDPYVINLNGDSSTKTNVYSLVSDIEYKTGDVILTSLTSYRETNETINTDFDASPFPLYETHRPQQHHQFSEEMRVTSNFDNSPLDFVAGLFYFNQKYTIQQSTTVFGSTGTPGYASQKAETFAGFANVGYHVTPELRISAGGRYMTLKKDFTVTPPGTALVFPGDKRFNNFQPKVGADYKLTNNNFLYASWARGVKTGGFNGRGSSSTSIGPYGDEKVDTFEAGSKNSFLENRVRLNLTAFYSKYKDMQIDVTKAGQNGQATETIIQNAASVKLWGLEAELTALVTQNFRLEASAGYLNAKYGKFCANIEMLVINPAFPAGCDPTDPMATDNTSLHPRFSPKWTSRVGFDYTVPMGASDELQFAGDMNYQSESFYTVQNTYIGRRPSAAFFNANVTWSHEDGKFTLTGYAKNIANKTINTNGLEVPGVLAFNFPNEPRVYGLEAGFKF